MDDLVTWLRAQLDEDERVARATIHPDHTGEWELSEYVEYGNDGDMARWDLTLDEIAPPLYDTSGMGPSPMRHIARHDPARVLREVEAKRRILDLHRRGESDECVVCDVGAQSCGCLGWGDYPCATLRLLALPHANRPGYRDEWAPES